MCVAIPLAGCGSSEGTRISGYGLSIELPGEWSGRILKRDPYAPVLRAVNFPIYLGTSMALGTTSSNMPSDGILIEVSDGGPAAGTGSGRPIQIRRSDFGTFGGIRAPSLALRHVVVDGQMLMVEVGFGTLDPSDAALAEANAVLSSFAVDRDPAHARRGDARDSVPFVSFGAPAGWYGAETSIAGDPPIPVAWTGNTPLVDDPVGTPFPRATLRGLPPDAIVIQAVGPRAVSESEDAPRLALPLTLTDGSFRATGYEGQPAPNVSAYRIDTRIAEKVLSVTVWLGRIDPTDEMLADANRIPAMLEIEP